MQLSKDTRVKKSRCPNCGLMLDGVSAVGDDVKGKTLLPSFGDLSVCIRCGHLLGFNDDMTVRELTPEEMIRAAGDQRLLAIQRARGIAMKRFPEQWKKAWEIDSDRVTKDLKCGTSLSTPSSGQSGPSTPAVILLPYRPPDSNRDR